MKHTVSPELAAAFARISESVSGFTSALSPVFARFQKVMAEHDRDLPKLLKVMAEYSWYTDLNMPISDSRQLEAYAEAGDYISLETRLVEYYRESAGAVESGVCEAYPLRSSIVKQAFRAYGDGSYDLAIPVLLAQADGISEGIIKKHFFRSTQSIAEAKKLLECNGINDYARLLLEPLLSAGAIRTHTSNLKDRTDFLNRHAIMHGSDLNYGTEKNALRSISLLSYLLMVGYLLNR